MALAPQFGCGPGFASSGLLTGLQWVIDDPIIGSAATAPFTATGIQSGTFTFNPPGAGHGVTSGLVGFVRAASIASLTSGAFYRSSAQFEAAVGLYGMLRWRTPAAFAGTEFRIGFHDSSNVGVAVTDGVWIVIDSSGVLTIFSRDGVSQTTHGTTYSPVAATWYELHIYVTSLASFRVLVRTIDGTVLLDQNITATLPGSGDLMNIAWMGWTTTSSAGTLGEIDHARLGVLLTDPN